MNATTAKWYFFTLGVIIEANSLSVLASSFKSSALMYLVFILRNKLKCIRWTSAKDLLAERVFGACLLAYFKSNFAERW